MHGHRRTLIEVARADAADKVVECHPQQLSSEVAIVRLKATSEVSHNPSHSIINSLLTPGPRQSLISSSQLIKDRDRQGPRIEGRHSYSRKQPHPQSFLSRHFVNHLASTLAVKVHPLLAGVNVAESTIIKADDGGVKEENQDTQKELRPLVVHAEHCLVPASRTPKGQTASHASRHEEERQEGALLVLLAQESVLVLDYVQSHETALHKLLGHDLAERFIAWSDSTIGSRIYIAAYAIWLSSGFLSFMFWTNPLFWLTAPSMILVLMYESGHRCFAVIKEVLKCFDVYFLMGELALLCIGICIGSCYKRAYNSLSVFISVPFYVIADAAPRTFQRVMQYQLIGFSGVVFVCAVFLYFHLLPDLCFYRVSIHGHIFLADETYMDVDSFSVTEFTVNRALTITILLLRMAVKGWFNGGACAVLTGSYTLVQVDTCRHQAKKQKRSVNHVTGPVNDNGWTPRSPGGTATHLACLREKKVDAMAVIDQAMSQPPPVNYPGRGRVPIRRFIVPKKPLITLTELQSRSSLLHKLFSNVRSKRLTMMVSNFRSWVKRYHFICYFFWIVPLLSMNFILYCSGQTSSSICSSFRGSIHQDNRTTGPGKFVDILVTASITLTIIHAFLQTILLNAELVRKLLRNFSVWVLLFQLVLFSVAVNSVLCFSASGLAISLTSLLCGMTVIMSDALPLTSWKARRLHTALFFLAHVVAVAVLHFRLAEGMCFDTITYRMDPFELSLLRLEKKNRVEEATGGPSSHLDSFPSTSADGSGVMPVQPSAGLALVSVVEFCLNRGYTLIFLMIRVLYLQVRHPATCALLEANITIEERLAPTLVPNGARIVQ